MPIANLLRTINRCSSSLPITLTFSMRRIRCPKSIVDAYFTNIDSSIRFQIITVYHRSLHKFDHMHGSWHRQYHSKWKWRHSFNLPVYKFGKFYIPYWSYLLPYRTDATLLQWSFNEDPWGWTWYWLGYFVIYSSCRRCLLNNSYSLGQKFSRLHPVPEGSFWIYFCWLNFNNGRYSQKRGLYSVCVSCEIDCSKRGN